MKKILPFLLIFILLAILVGIFYFLQNEKAISTEEGIIVVSPRKNEKIKSPLKIEGQARGTWFF